MAIWPRRGQRSSRQRLHHSGIADAVVFENIEHYNRQHEARFSLEDPFTLECLVLAVLDMLHPPFQKFFIIMQQASRPARLIVRSAYSSSNTAPRPLSLIVRANFPEDGFIAVSTVLPSSRAVCLIGDQP